MNPNKNKKWILVPKESLMLGALSWHFAIKCLAYYWGVLEADCYSTVANEADSCSEKLTPEEEADIIEAWTKTIEERNCECN